MEDDLRKRLDQALKMLNNMASSYDSMTKSNVKVHTPDDLPDDFFFRGDMEEGDVRTYRINNFRSGLSNSIRKTLGDTSKETIKEYRNKLERERQDIDHSGRGSSCCQHDSVLKDKIMAANWLISGNPTRKVEEQV